MKRVAIACLLATGAAAAVVPVALAAGSGGSAESGSEASAPAMQAKQGLCIDLSPLEMASICIGPVL